MEEYTFERLWYELSQGYQIQYTYMDNRYQLSRVEKNCYSQELLTIKEKSPHPRFSMLTLKRVKELFPYMTDIEYKVRNIKKHNTQTIVEGDYFNIKITKIGRCKNKL